MIPWGRSRVSTRNDLETAGQIEALLDAAGELDGEARGAAKEWAGDGSQEVSLLDLPRWPLLAMLEVVRLGAGNIFREEPDDDA